MAWFISPHLVHLSIHSVHFKPWNSEIPNI